MVSWFSGKGLSNIIIIVHSVETLAKCCPSVFHLSIVCTITLRDRSLPNRNSCRKLQPRIIQEQPLISWNCGHSLALCGLGSLATVDGSSCWGPEIETKRFATGHHHWLRHTFLHFWVQPSFPPLLHLLRQPFLPSISTSHQRVYPLHSFSANHNWLLWLTNFTVKWLTSLRGNGVGKIWACDRTSVKKEAAAVTNLNERILSGDKGQTMGKSDTLLNKTTPFMAKEPKMEQQRSDKVVGE